jgi:hypothetical protein
MATLRRADRHRAAFRGTNASGAGRPRSGLSRVRAVIQEALSAHFFMTHPGYLEWMLTLKGVQLGIEQNTASRQSTIFSPGTQKVLDRF